MFKIITVAISAFYFWSISLMVIKGICTLPIESLKEYSLQAQKSPCFPEYIKQEGPYFAFGKNGKVQQIALYEFEKGKFMEVCKYISDQIDEFKNIPGFSFSVELLEKEK